MKRTLIILLILILMPTVSSIAQTIEDKTGTAGFQFLKLGIGAREVALGGAITAVVEGPSAIFWNPAGICLDNKTSFTVFNNPWIATINHNFIGFSTPISGTNFIGAAVDFITMDDMEETTIDKPQGTGRYFTSYDFAVILTYGRQITDRFNAALSVKYINERIWDMVADGFAFDIGFIYRFNRFRVGMSFNNFGTEKYISGDQLENEYQIFPDYKTDDVLLSRVPHTIRLPINFRFGASYEMLKINYHKLLLLTDVAYFNDIGEVENVGLEYKFFDNYALRTGYKFNRDVLDFAFGGGVKFYLRNICLQIDYAAVNMADFGYRHQTSFTFSF